MLRDGRPRDRFGKRYPLDLTWMADEGTGPAASHDLIAHRRRSIPEVPTRLSTQRSRGRKP